MQDWFVFNMVSCLSVAPAAILGVVNCRTVATRFMPFVVITWFGLLNELVSLYYIFQINSNAVNSNIYVLVEFLLFLWLFNRWQQGYYKRWFLILVGFGFLVWLTDNLLMTMRTALRLRILTKMLMEVLGVKAVLITLLIILVMTPMAIYKPWHNMVGK